MTRLSRISDGFHLGYCVVSIDTLDDDQRYVKQRQTWTVERHSPRGFMTKVGTPLHEIFHVAQFDTLIPLSESAMVNEWDESSRLSCSYP